MQLWFRRLARKCLSGQKFHVPCRTARQRSVCLRLEAVEDRTVASVATLDPPDLLTPAPDANDGIPRQVVVIPSDDLGAVDSDKSVTDPGDAISEMSPGEWPGGGTPALESGDSPVPVVREQRFSPNPVPLAAEPGTRPLGSVGVPGTVEAERLESIVAQPGPPEETQSDKSRARSRSESTDASPVAIDGGRVPQDRASTASEADGARGAPTGHTPKSAPAASEDRADDNQVQRSRRPDSPAARPSQDISDRVSTKVDGAATHLRPGERAEISVPRSDVNRLTAEMPDGSLLQRFVANREEAAFTALVRRHERFVLSVCQRVLGDAHAAQDAFQTTFMVLARKAGMLDRQGPLSGWLYKVAYHAALRLRVVAARQRLVETEAADEGSSSSEIDSSTEVEKLEMRQAVREELQRLPEKYRTPLVLCYFDGRTHDDAAREIGLPRGSMAKRIGEGLERLRERLVDRGFSL